LVRICIDAGPGEDGLDSAQESFGIVAGQIAGDRLSFLPERFGRLPPRPAVEPLGPMPDIQSRDREPSRGRHGVVKKGCEFPHVHDRILDAVQRQAFVSVDRAIWIVRNADTRRLHNALEPQKSIVLLSLPQAPDDARQLTALRHGWRAIGKFAKPSQRRLR
jgi:hypothetical protein